MKTASAISKFQKAGATIEEAPMRRYVARFPAATVTINNSSDGYVESLYVLKNGAKDEIETDYFAGTFKNTIKGAIELAQRMATW